MLSVRGLTTTYRDKTVLGDGLGNSPAFTHRKLHGSQCQAGCYQPGRHIAARAPLMSIAGTGLHLCGHVALLKNV